MLDEKKPVVWQLSFPMSLEYEVRHSHSLVIAD